ncbi:MAG: transposase [Gammaproteobacteria bacterium]|nr:transposase [Gammaproteobacteria bacterium]
MVALLIISRLRSLSDRAAVQQVKENRYIQYFCNVTDENLKTFVHPSSLCRFRQRLGDEGIAIIEEEIFKKLRDAGIITGDDALIDSSVLESNIIFPTDIQLIFKAFVKLAVFANNNSIPLWWDDENVKKLWRECNLDKNKTRLEWLQIFFEIFAPALNIFQEKVTTLKVSEKQIDKAVNLLVLLNLLKEQTIQKLDGQQHIKNRIVSLDDADTRPIKKGKKHPKCEFGTTEEFAFNRDGFLITVENFIGKPNDAKLYPDTVELYIERMNRCPNTVVTDGAYRSQDNIRNKTPVEVKHLFMGRSTDVAEEQRDFCQKARSATEGFIAVAKNLRGFGKSMYHGLQGHRIWSLLCQAAYNLKKFLLLYFEDKIEEEPLIKLGILS